MVAGGSSARVLDLTGAEIKDIQAESVELPMGQTVFSVAWSPDGQLLTISTTVGALEPRICCLFAVTVTHCVHCTTQGIPHTVLSRMQSPQNL